MKSLLYVSRRRPMADVSECMQDLGAIVETSRARNAEMQITGALVATPTHFAQVLEGSEAAIDEVMARIMRDERHTDIVVGPLEGRTDREYPRWALAYHGESSFVAGLIESTLNSPDFEVADNLRNIRNLIAMFA